MSACSYPKPCRLPPTSTPALGIVAAVLGVIRAMGSISEPPVVLGHLIAGALCGTFMGVWLSYGFIGPVASNLRSRTDAEMKYYLCMKAGILAYLQGSAPQIAIEFARKVLLAEDRPTFLEVEDATMAFPVKVEGPPPTMTAKPQSNPHNHFSQGLINVATSGHTAPIVIKRKKAAAHGHHGGAWKVAYADFVTAMMAFFLLLWLLNVTTQQQEAGDCELFRPDQRV